MTYKKLPGKSFRFGFHRSSLWIAPDHLLLVRNRGYSEEYKRFYFKDIEAFIVTPSSVGNLISGIITVFTCFPALLLIIGVIRQWGSVSMIIWASITTLLLLLLFMHRMKGPTCRTQIQTAVQKEDLTSLFRRRTSQRVIQMVVPLIEAVQGSLVQSQPEAAETAS